MSVLADLTLRTKIGALVGLVSVLGGGAALAFGPIVRSRRGAAAAERRGLRIEVGELRLGLGSIWLRNVDLSAPLMPGVKARVAALRVGLSWSCQIAELALHGASVAISGETDELERQYSAYRAARPKEPTVRGGPRYAVDGVELVWSAGATSPTQRVWGMRYERDGERESVALDLARLSISGMEVEARQLQARLRRVNGERQLENLQAEGLDLGISLAAEPKSSPRVASGAAPEIAFQPDPSRGLKLRAGLGALSILASSSLPEGAALNLDGVQLRLQRGAERLNVGPSTLRVERLGTEVDLSLVPKAEASGTPLELKLSLPLEHGDVRAEVRGGPVSLKSLGVREGDFGLIGVQAASLQASGEMTLVADGSTLAFRAAARSIKCRCLAPSSRLLRSAAFTWRSARAARPRSTAPRSCCKTANFRWARFDCAAVARSPAASARCTLIGRPRYRSLLARPCSMRRPHGLAPLIAPLRMSGTFAVNANLAYDSEHPSETKVHLAVENDCRIGEISPDLSPHRFASAWQRVVKGPDRQPMEVESGPGSPDWVPIDAISPFMVAAVLVCEDGHFERHRGFDYEAIQNSIRDKRDQGQVRARREHHQHAARAEPVPRQGEDARAQAAGGRVDAALRAGARQA